MNSAAPSRERLVSEARAFHARGWMAGTSGNLSLRVGDTPTSPVAITASGVDKGRLTPRDILLVAPDGTPLEDLGEHRPSAETAIHLAIYRRIPEARAVFHVHTLATTLASTLTQGDASPGSLPIAGYEMVKGFDLWESDATAHVPVFSNHSDVARIASEVDAFLAEPAPVPAFLIRGHGITAWGGDVDTARKHIEIGEFLCACHWGAQLRG